MKLNIMPTDCVGLNCFDGLIISTAEWKKLDFNLAYAEAWDFGFNYEIEENTPSNIGRLRTPKSISYDILKTYCGISLDEKVYNGNLDIFLVFIKEELAQQRPILIVHDYFWCPWNKEGFQKNHVANHVSLVVGFDEAGLYCVDYSPRCDDCILPYEYINKSLKSYYTINIEKQSPAMDYNYMDIISRSIEVIGDKDIFNAIRKYAKHIQESYDPIKYLEQARNEGFFGTPLIWETYLISEGRSLYCNTLRSINKKYNSKSLYTIIEKLEATKPMWSTVKALLTKSFIGNDLGLTERLAKRIYEIADFEETIYKCLVMFNKDSASQVQLSNIFDNLDKKHNSSTQNILYLDLQKYFNNRAFDNDEGCKYIPNCTGEGGFALRDEYICSKIISNKQFTFKIADLFEDKYDNILCKGQTLQFHNENFAKISILGCASFGNFSEYMIVNYSDGSFDKIKIELSDWFPGSAEFDQAIMWVGASSKDNKTKKRGYDCQLYAEEYALNHWKNISNIILPDCPKMHIFAISLYMKNNV